jgi:3-methyladenine DNA glycosylase AlkD
VPITGYSLGMEDQGTPAMRAARIEARLREVSTPERAIGEKQYLKSDLDFLGATVWQIRAEVKAAVAEMAALDHDQLVALAQVLWSEPIFERRMAASGLLEVRSDLLGARDLELIERLLRESHTWALVDGLAADVVGSILAADEKGARRVLHRWARDEDFWIRRSALLAWLRPLRGGASLDDFLGYADLMLDEKEFFIRKAIGWVLREVGKRRPDEVTRWLAPRTHRASGVTMREATKYLPKADSGRLMLAYREKRPADTASPA